MKVVKLLFFTLPMCVLPESPNAPPVSGIVDWVLRTDFWDTTPLIHYPSHQEILKIRINQNLKFWPRLHQKWLAIEQKNCNPVDMTIAEYQDERNLQNAKICVDEFQSYLKYQMKYKAAQTYISNIKYLISLIKGEMDLNSASDLFRAIGSGKRCAKFSAASADFIIDDILEFTKPDSLSLVEWRWLVLCQA
ncbi:MAG TPA: hypothetical protein VLE95_08775 [Chlamydiales bacterium]|nr:hypothetical protein [Chlamydiales bacterium]